MCTFLRFQAATARLHTIKHLNTTNVIADTIRFDENILSLMWFIYLFLHDIRWLNKERKRINDQYPGVCFLSHQTFMRVLHSIMRWFHSHILCVIPVKLVMGILSHLRLFCDPIIMHPKYRHQIICLIKYTIYQN